MDRFSSLKSTYKNSLDTCKAIPRIIPEPHLQFPSSLEKMAPTTRSTANKARLETKPTQRKTHQRLRLYLKPLSRCIQCKGSSFASTEPDSPRKVGRLGCQSCGTEFEHETTQVATAKTKGPFRCIYCNGSSFDFTELDSSLNVGRVDCQKCGAEFKHKTTANLCCAKDVKAALLVGKKIGWLTAQQGPAHP